MKLPVTINIKYIGESDLPIMTVDSTHVISSESDLNVLSDYVNMFSELTFTRLTVEHAISECQEKHVCNFKSDGEWLSFSVV